MHWQWEWGLAIKSVYNIISSKFDCSKLTRYTKMAKIYTSLDDMISWILSTMYHVYLISWLSTDP